MTNVVAYVVDDPSVLFKVAVVSSGTTMSTLTRAAVGANCTVAANSGNANTGDAIIYNSTTKNFQVVPVTNAITDLDAGFF